MIRLPEISFNNKGRFIKVSKFVDIFQPHEAFFLYNLIHKQKKFYLGTFCNKK